MLQAYLTIKISTVVLHEKSNTHANILFSSGLIEGIKMMKVPSATIIRLEYLLSLLHISCQNSERFCLLLGETGVIQSLDDMLHTFVTYEIYCGLPQVCEQNIM